MLDEEGEEVSDVFTLEDIDKAVEAAAGISPVFKGRSYDISIRDVYTNEFMRGAPYLFPDQLHDLDLLDRSVAAELLVRSVEWPDTSDIPELHHIPCRMSALEERIEMWREHHIPWHRVDWYACSTSIGP